MIFRQLIRAIKHRFLQYTEVWISYRPTSVYVAHIYDYTRFGKRYIDSTVIEIDLDDLFVRVFDKLQNKKNVNFIYYNVLNRCPSQDDESGN